MKKILTSLSLGLILPILGAAATFITPSVASAASGILYVGHGSTGNNRSCASPGYNSVQAAVNAANPGSTVYLCGGQFAQQVFINKDNIVLTGDPTSGLTAPASAAGFATAASYPAKFTSDGLFVPQALLVTTGNNVTVQGLTISGPLPGNGGCAEDEFGVLALAGSISLQNDKVLNIADVNTGLEGCQFGVAIQVGRMYWPPTNFGTDLVENFHATANIDKVTVSGYAKNGVTVDGTGSYVNMVNSSVTGNPSAPFGTIVAQNGIQISRGATGNVSNNVVSNNQYSGAGEASSAGILVFGGCGDPLDKNVNISGNGLINDDVGVFADNYNAACTGPATTVTNVNVSLNRISNNGDTNISGNGPTQGYQAGIEEVGDRDNITFNAISGVGYAVMDSSSMYSRPIDVVSFPTTKPNVFGNTYDGHLYNG